MTEAQKEAFLLMAEQAQKVIDEMPEGEAKAECQHEQNVLLDTFKRKNGQSEG